MKLIENENNYRRDENGWVFVHVEGSPAERGLYYGYLMANEIVSAVTEAKSLVELQTGVPWDFFLNSDLSIIHSWKKHLKSYMYKEFYDELEAIAIGVKIGAPESNISTDDLILWNGYEELTDYWFPTAASQIYQHVEGQKSDSNSSMRTFNNFHKGASDHCSAFIATGSYTENGKIVMAHNCFTPFENGNYLNVVADIVPEKGYKFIMQTEPGYIHSMSDFYETKTGNDTGLMITETTIVGFNAYDASGAPEFVRIRYAVQYADSLDDFVNKFWENNNGGYANTWLVGDIATREIMRFEAGLKFYKVDKTTDGYFAGFNAPLDPRIRNLECSNSGFADIRRHQGARQIRIPQLVEKNKGSINNTVAQEILADHYDVYLGKENPCSRTVCAHYELDDRAFMSQPGRPVPFQPRGAVDGVTADSDNAKELSLWGRWGSSCGTAFYAESFLEKNPQFEYLRPYLKDRPSQPWTKFMNKK